MLEYRSQSILTQKDGGENSIENKEKGWENRCSGCKKVKLGRRNLFLCGSTSFSSHSLLRGVALNPSIKLNKKTKVGFYKTWCVWLRHGVDDKVSPWSWCGGALSRLCRGTSSLQTLSPRQSSRSLWLSKTTSSASFSSKILSLFQFLAADQ